MVQIHFGVGAAGWSVQAAGVLGPSDPLNLCVVAVFVPPAGLQKVGPQLPPV